MVAGDSACTCPECETVCKGRFRGCEEVWARGPREVSQELVPLVTRPRSEQAPAPRRNGDEPAGDDELVRLRREVADLAGSIQRQQGALATVLGAIAASDARHDQEAWSVHESLGSLRSTHAEIQLRLDKIEDELAQGGRPGPTAVEMGRALLRGRRRG